MTRSAKSIVGKTITGVISRPVGGGRDSIVMLQFSDGSCFEFVSPRACSALNRGCSGASRASRGARSQLSFFPQDGVAGNAQAPAAAAA